MITLKTVAKDFRSKDQLIKKWKEIYNTFFLSENYLEYCKIQISNLHHAEQDQGDSI